MVLLHVLHMCPSVPLVWTMLSIIYTDGLLLDWLVHRTYKLVLLTQCLGSSRMAVNHSLHLAVLLWNRFKDSAVHLDLRFSNE